MQIRDIKRFRACAGDADIIHKSVGLDLRAVGIRNEHVIRYRYIPFIRDGNIRNGKRKNIGFRPLAHRERNGRGRVGAQPKAKPVRIEHIHTERRRPGNAAFNGVVVNDAAVGNDLQRLLRGFRFIHGIDTDVADVVRHERDIVGGDIIKRHKTDALAALHRREKIDPVRNIFRESEKGLIIGVIFKQRRLRAEDPVIKILLGLLAVVSEKKRTRRLNGFRKLRAERVGVALRVNPRGRDHRQSHREYYDYRNCFSHRFSPTSK